MAFAAAFSFRVVAGLARRETQTRSSIQLGFRTAGVALAQFIAVDAAGRTEETVVEDWEEELARGTHLLAAAVSRQHQRRLAEGAGVEFVRRSARQAAVCALLAFQVVLRFSARTDGTAGAV